MKLAEMQLKHYHFIQLHLEALNNEFLDGTVKQSLYKEPDADKLKTTIVFGEPEAIEEGAEYFFVLTLGLEYKQANFPYYFKAELEGVFTLGELAKDEQLRHRLVVNATSVLYSSARDQLLTLSARHKHGPIMLPSLDFRTITAAE